MDKEKGKKYEKKTTSICQLCVRGSHFWETLHIDQLFSHNVTGYMQVLADSTQFLLP